MNPINTLLSKILIVLCCAGAVVVTAKETFGSELKLPKGLNQLAIPDDGIQGLLMPPSLLKDGQWGLTPDKKFLEKFLDKNLDERMKSLRNNIGDAHSANQDVAGVGIDPRIVVEVDPSIDPEMVLLTNGNGDVLGRQIQRSLHSSIMGPATILGGNSYIGADQQAGVSMSAEKSVAPGNVFGTVPFSINTPLPVETGADIPPIK